MEKQKTQGYFGKHAKSSAAVISLGIHAAVLAVAISFVAFRVMITPENEFEIKQFKRATMDLKRLPIPAQIKKKKIPPPQFRENIVSEHKTKSMDIKMPEIAGFKGESSYLDGGLDINLSWGLDTDLFGGNQGTGNELEGTFFDLKMKPDGSPAKMDDNHYKDVLKNFLGSWSISRIEKRYFAAPKKKFATTFMLPKMPANEAPKAYAVEDVVQPKQWMAYYNGVISAPETGRYRFWGIADDVLMVRVKKRLVIDANYPGMNISDWTSNDDLDRKVKMSGQGLRVGDWFHLTKGTPTKMEVLVGERPGGYFFCHLLIEQDGVEYPKGKDGLPLLPIFKMSQISEELIPKMAVDSNTCTVDGPTFGIMK